MPLLFRRSKKRILVRLGQGSLLASYDWQVYMRDYNLFSNMRHRGYFHDNAVAEWPIPKIR